MYQDSKEYIITFDAISGNIELTGDNGPIFGIEEWEDRITFHRVEIGNYTKNGYKSFYSCYGLENVVIPEGVVSVDDYAFEYCHSLKTISFPSPLVTNIGASAFFRCTNLTTVDLPDATDIVP